MVKNERSLQTTERSPQLLPDDVLLRRLVDLSRDSRRLEADLVEHVGEVDARRLYAREACTSMFAYCTERLHLSEAEAYLRITAGRAAREHPVILEMLADGRLHLSAIARLAPHLTAENRDAILRRAAHRSKRGILELVAELSPRADVPAVMRRMPDGRSVPGLVLDPGIRHAAGDDRGTIPPARPSPSPGAWSAAQITLSGQSSSPVFEPIAPARYKVQFTAGDELRDKLERLRALMRSSVPDGDLAKIIGAAVTEKLARLEAQRFGRTERPRKSLDQSVISPSSRHVPAAVRRAVSDRDGDQCAYRDAQGRRCGARERLEFHHRRPYGCGGDHSITNVALLCRTHNAAMALVDYGSQVGRSGRATAPASEPGG